MRGGAARWPAAADECGLHRPTITTTHRPIDCFRRRYWVRCLRPGCHMRSGPYPTLGAARFVTTIQRHREAS
jgi:hypothetical protein